MSYTRDVEHYTHETGFNVNDDEDDYIYVTVAGYYVS